MTPAWKHSFSAMITVHYSAHGCVLHILHVWFYVHIMCSKLNFTYPRLLTYVVCAWEKKKKIYISFQ